MNESECIDDVRPIEDTEPKRTDCLRHKEEDATSNHSQSSSESKEIDIEENNKCPLFGLFLPVEEVEIHANVCIDKKNE